MDNNAPQPAVHHLSKYLIIGIVVIGFITTFTSGFVLSSLLSSEKSLKNNQNGKITPTPKEVSTTPKLLPENPAVPQDSTKFLPGKHYYDDTIMLVTKDAPQLTLIATATRGEQEQGYIQSTRVSYFDGKNWTRLSDSKNTQDSTIVAGKLLKNWLVNIDPSRVLKQSVTAEVTFNNNDLAVISNTLLNEIGMRSLPGYTKFISQGTATLTVNGTLHEAHILYSRIYSENAADIQFYTQPFGLTTDWLAFWDDQGNFYHIDTTSVDKPTPIYQTHEIGVMEDSKGGVYKSFNLKVTRDGKNPPENYTFFIDYPVSSTLTLSRVNGVNKAPDGSYTWYLGNVEGTVTGAGGQAQNGVGIVEYIHD